MKMTDTFLDTSSLKTHSVFGDKSVFAIEVIVTFKGSNGNLAGHIFIWIRNIRIGNPLITGTLGIGVSTIEELLVTPTKYSNRELGMSDAKKIIEMYTHTIFMRADEDFDKETELRSQIISYSLGEWFDDSFVLAIKIENGWRFMWLSKQWTKKEDILNLKEAVIDERIVNKAIFSFLFWIYSSDTALKTHNGLQTLT